MIKREEPRDLNCGLAQHGRNNGGCIPLLHRAFSVSSTAIIAVFRSVDGHGDHLALDMMPKPHAVQYLPVVKLIGFAACIGEALSSR